MGNAITPVSTQPLKWHGGKSYQAKWLHSLAPPSCREDKENGYTHRNIAFAGGLGEFWNWLPIDGISESVNDANRQLSNFYATLRSPLAFCVFAELCEASPLSSELWEQSANADAPIGPDVDPHSAHAFFVRYRMSRQGLGKCYTTPTTRTRRGMNEQASAWLSAVEGLASCHERLRRVEIRNMNAIDFISAYDHRRALFYCDPPYIHETRASVGEYGSHEMSVGQHRELLERLSRMDGCFMLSGYHSPLYDDWAASRRWRVHELEIDNKASGARTKAKKLECVWTNF